MAPGKASSTHLVYKSSLSIPRLMSNQITGCCQDVLTGHIFADRLSSEGQMFLAATLISADTRKNDEGDEVRCHTVEYLNRPNWEIGHN